ncbi:unnamed protein product, partial [Polarella glacialis]
MAPSKDPPKSRPCDGQGIFTASDKGGARDSDRGRDRKKESRSKRAASEDSEDSVPRGHQKPGEGRGRDESRRQNHDDRGGDRGGRDRSRSRD